MSIIDFFFIFDIFWASYRSRQLFLLTFCFAEWGWIFKIKSCQWRFQIYNPGVNRWQSLLPHFKDFLRWTCPSFNFRELQFACSYILNWSNPSIWSHRSLHVATTAYVRRLYQYTSMPSPGILSRDLDPPLRAEGCLNNEAVSWLYDRSHWSIFLAASCLYIETVP